MVWSNLYMYFQMVWSNPEMLDPLLGIPVKGIFTAPAFHKHILLYLVHLCDTNGV